MRYSELTKEQLDIVKQLEFIWKMQGYTITESDKQAFVRIAQGVDVKHEVKLLIKKYKEKDICL